MLYASYGDMWRWVLDMAGRMPEVDAVAGVPVSGLVPAAMLSAATGVKCVSLDNVPDNIKRLLVVEDASGFAKFRQQRLGQAPGREVVYGAVYACDAASNLDLIGCIADKPRVFTWNLFKTDKSRSIAYDMDGVLCVNPTAEQIDYAARYSNFIATTKPIRKTYTELGWIVSGRMERYRVETEQWLTENGIQYREIVLTGNDHKHTMEAHAQYKADWYLSHPECLLYVESHPRQAARIAELSGKAVVCAETEQSWNTRAPVAVEVQGCKHNDKIMYTISTGEYEKYAPKIVSVPQGWDYRIITSADCPGYLNPKQQAAWAKINGPRIFAEYEASFCLDDDMIVDSDPAMYFEESDMTTLRRDAVTTWRKDIEIAASARRATSRENVNAERKRLTAQGFSDSPCYMSGIVWRKHTDQVKALCDEWWFWYSQSETQRDQPSLAVACQRLKYEPDTVTEDAIKTHIRHDIRKADRDGVRARVETTQRTKRRIRRKGDRI